MPLFRTKKHFLDDGRPRFELEGYEEQHFYGEDGDEGGYERLPPLSIAGENSLRVCMSAIYKCAKRIAASPEHYNFPNLDYLLDQALPEVLHQYLPDRYQFDPIKKEIAPRLGALWKHRDAPSPQVRDSFFRNNWDSGFFSAARFIYEVPWYRDWYPKRVSLAPHNLLGSLPVALVSTSVAPYLCEADIAALKEICPNLMA